MALDDFLVSNIGGKVVQVYSQHSAFTLFVTANNFLCSLVPFIHDWCWVLLQTDTCSRQVQDTQHNPQQDSYKPGALLEEIKSSIELNCDP